MCRCRYSNTHLAQVRHAHAGAVCAHEVRVVPAQLIMLPRLLCFLHEQAQVNMCRLVRNNGTCGSSVRLQLPTSSASVTAPLQAVAIV
jgi:hypothetical protein